MRVNLRTTLRTTLGVIVLAAAMAAPARADDPQATFDYLQIQGLSQPTYQVARTSYEVPMFDGISLYVEVVKPTAPGQYPVIMEISPYHGTGESDRSGGTIGWPFYQEEQRQAGLTDYFSPRGYAVVVADLRGTGRSQGCLDELGPNDAKDTKSLVEWAAKQGWSNGRVGVTGFSYPAAAAILAASQHPEGLVTAVPLAGLASMYDHQFQAGVPYAFQWAGPIASYPAQGTQRHLPPGPDNLKQSEFATGDNFGNDPQYTGCGWTGSALLSGESNLSGQYGPWHAARDYQQAATDSPIPIFLIHGIYDSAARIPAADWFFRRPASRGDKLWLGPWDHGPARAAQLTYAMHAWFDHHLKQLDVDTGPAVEVFFSNGETRSEAGYWDKRTYTAPFASWPAPDSSMTLYPHTDGGFRPQAQATGGTVAFTGDPRDTNTGVNFIGDEYDERTEETGHVEFVSDEATSETMLLGLPALRLSASVSVPRVHLIATVYDESPSGARRRITTFALNPERRNGLDQIAPVVPSLRMDMSPPGFRMAHLLEPGHRVVLRVTTSNKDKIAMFAGDPRVTVFTGADATRLDMPVVSGATLLEDTVLFDPNAPPEPEE